MFAIFKLIPLKDWLYLAIIAAVVAFGVYEHFHLIHVGEARVRAQVAARSAQAQVAAQKRIIANTEQHAASVAAVEQSYENRYQASQSQLHGDAERLREYDAYRRSHAMLGRAAAGPGAPAAQPSGARAGNGRYSRLEQVAFQLARATFKTDNALTECTTERDSLTGE